jgi:hypothetical protein
VGDAGFAAGGDGIAYPAAVGCAAFLFLLWLWLRTKADAAATDFGGGVFGESYATCGAVENVVGVDLRIPGCPPTPLALMQGILAAVRMSR